jgi:hypothetical protein
MENDIVMTAQDIFEVMARLLANNTDMTDEEIHQAIDRGMAEQLASKFQFQQELLKKH